MELSANKQDIENSKLKAECFLKANKKRSLKNKLAIVAFGTFFVLDIIFSFLITKNLFTGLIWGGFTFFGLGLETLDAINCAKEIKTYKEIKKNCERELENFKNVETLEATKNKIEKQTLISSKNNSNTKTDTLDKSF